MLVADRALLTEALWTTVIATTIVRWWLETVTSVCIIIHNTDSHHNCHMVRYSCVIVITTVIATTIVSWRLEIVIPLCMLCALYFYNKFI